MIYDFSIFRIPSEYPPMPVYANPKMYIEEYFYNYWIRNQIMITKGRPIYIPIFWTPIYVQNTRLPIQSYLNILNPTNKYFTIVQYDEGILNKLPPNTKVFSAASNRGNGKEKIPIPLIVSPIPENIINNYDDEKKYICSFVGRATHKLRYDAYMQLHDKKDFYFSDLAPWQQTLSFNKFEEFIKITKQSKFALSIEGNAPTAFRLYEIMQLGTIPVYLTSSYHWLPWQDELHWNEFCVLIKQEQISDLENILRSISDEKYVQMQTKMKEVYVKYFTLPAMCEQIIKRI